MTALRLAGPRSRQAAVGVLIGLGLGATTAISDSTLALVGPTLIGALLLTIVVRALTPDQAERRRVLHWTMAAFFGHLAFGLVLANVGGPVRRYLAAPDAVGYDFLARHILAHWTSGTPLPQLAAGKEGFYYLLAGIYWVFGPHVAAGLAVNATLGAGVVPLITDTTRRLFGPSAARFATPLVVLLPGLFLWTSQLLKEAAIVFLVVAAANCAVRVTERLSVAAVTGLAVSLSLLFTFRAWVALVMAAGFMAGVALGRRRLLSGLGTGLSGASLVALLVALGLGYSGYRTAVDADFEQANELRRGLAATASTGFDTNVDVSTPAAALSYLPRGLTNFALGPFPWQIRTGRQLPVIPDVVVWWCLLPALWVGTRAARRLVGRRVLVLLLPALAASVLLSLSVGNYGTIVREREQVVVLLAPLVALGLSVRSERKARPEPLAPIRVGEQPLLDDRVVTAAGPRVG